MPSKSLLFLSCVVGLSRSAGESTRIRDQVARPFVCSLSSYLLMRVTHASIQVTHVSLALLQGAQQFAAALSNITVPSIRPDPVEPAVVSNERATMIAWWCKQPLSQSHMCSQRDAEHNLSWGQEIASKASAEVTSLLHLLSSSTSLVLQSSEACPSRSVAGG